jgi:hypothetical protein
MRELVIAVVLTMSVGLAMSAAAATDLPGSRDPLGLERFSHAWIVNYQRDDELLAREFIVSRLDKTRRDVRAERKVRTQARLESATYRIPDGVPRQEVIDYYQGLLVGDSLFSCQGRDCGRSNHWANYIFKQAILFGPDNNQFYMAVNHGGQLVGVYVVERGNKRVYAHLVVFEPAAPVAIAVNQILTEHLAGDGYAVIDGVTPLPNGQLQVAAEEALKELADRLAIFAGQRIYVVCHLYGSSATTELLAASERCSRAAAALLETPGGPELLAFAAGPLLPRAAGSVSRIELVLPHRLQHQ